MKFNTLLALALVLVLATTAFGLERKAFQIKEDFGTAPLYDCALQYYYYSPCPTYSWFWAFTGWAPGDIIGTMFTIGDASTGGWATCDGSLCQTLEQIRILDFAGYGTIYPGQFSVEFDVWCANDAGCPVGGSLWNSGQLDTHFGWNYFVVDPPLCLTSCTTVPGPPPREPRILVTATITGTDGISPAFGLDNISTAIAQGCILHGVGCMPALYPRPYVSHYPAIHSGYYGVNFQYCPPLNFCDGRDTTCVASLCMPDGSNGQQFGFIELAWRIYVVCEGPTAREPSSWSNIKRIYR